jgi:hypothetical protein
VLAVLLGLLRRRTPDTAPELEPSLAPAADDSAPADAAVPSVAVPTAAAAAAAPVVVSGGSGITAPAAGGLSDVVRQLGAMFPHVSVYAIAADIAYSRSAEVTVERILSGRLPLNTASAESERVADCADEPC